MKKLLFILVLISISFGQYLHNSTVHIRGYQKADAVPYADSTATGRVAEFTAGETLNFGDVVYLKSDGEMYLIDADAEATLPGVYMALDGITDGDDGLFLVNGWVRNDAWNFTVGIMLYASLVGTTGNTITETRPTVAGDYVQLLGFALSADVMNFQPNIMLIKLN